MAPHPHPLHPQPLLHTPTQPQLRRPHPRRSHHQQDRARFDVPLFIITPAIRQEVINVFTTLTTLVVHSGPCSSWLCKWLEAVGGFGCVRRLEFPEFDSYVRDMGVDGHTSCDIELLKRYTALRNLRIQ
ncbi:hypothetical protein K402DRAFT_467379, partial [Aulographum hederae CBS 113979]